MIETPVPPAPLATPPAPVPMPPKSKRKVEIAAAAFVIVVLAAVGAYMYWQNSQQIAATPISNNTNQAPQSWFGEVSVSSSTQKIEQATGPIFYPATIKVGDTVGQFTVSKIEPYDSRLPADEHDMRLTFSGHMSLTGTYSGLGELDAKPYVELTPAEISLLPMNDDLRQHFKYTNSVCIENAELFDPAVKIGDSVVIELTGFTFKSFGTSAPCAPSITISSMKGSDITPAQATANYAGHSYFDDMKQYYDLVLRPGETGTTKDGAASISLGAFKFGSPLVAPITVRYGDNASSTVIYTVSKPVTFDLGELVHVMVCGISRSIDTPQGYVEFAVSRGNVVPACFNPMP